MRAGYLLPPVLVLALLAPRAARAQGSEPYPWVAYAGLGLALGSGTGLASSYLLDREGHGFEHHPRLYGTGVGALSGLGLGLTLGIVDRAADIDGGFGFIAGGAVLGACGALLGGIENVSADFLGKVPIRSGDFEPLDRSAFAVGAAWGTLVGVAGALVLTLVAAGPREDPHRRPFFVFTVETTPGADGRRLWMPTVVGAGF